MYFELIIAFLVLSHLWEQYLDVRQHACFSSTAISKELAPFISNEKFLQSQKYNHAKSTFAFVKDNILFVQSVALLWYGLYAWLWGVCVEHTAVLSSATGGFISPYSEDAQIVPSILFFLYNTLYSTLFDLPFELYSTFVIEEKFGFNKQTIGIFVGDQAKVLALTAFIASPIIAGVIKLIDFGGEHFYFFVWIFLLVVQLILVTVYPVYIAPLFNKYEELPEGSLRTKIEELASKLKFPLTKLYVVDGSQRSSHSNAYFYGFFKNKRIVIYDTLIEQASEDGIVAILGHELGHWHKGHTLKNLAVTQAYLLLFFFLFGQFVHNTALYEAFGFTDQPILIGLTLFSLLYNPIGNVFGFLVKLLSRKFEYEADEFATKLGYDLRTPLAVIHAENCANMNPDSLYSAYHFSHPTLKERLHAIEALRSKAD